MHNHCRDSIHAVHKIGTIIVGTQFIVSTEGGISLYQELINTLSKTEVLLEERMANHTSFRIGGPADLFCAVNSKEDLKKILGYTKEKQIPLLIVGNGSNLLVSDKGFRGIVLKLGEAFSSLSVEGSSIIAGAAVDLRRLCRFALENSLTGMEWAYGIPGTLAGAVFMNAGAYGGEFSQILESTTYWEEDFAEKEISNQEHDFSYRTSVFQKEKKNAIILSAKVKLSQGNPAEIEAKMKDYMERRITKQPLNLPSAGSVFRRPENAYVGQMVEELGLKGFSIGGAQVSEKHAGFIVNTGKASCEDVKHLIQYIQRKVEEQYGIKLKTEVREVGE
ncbi:MAG: UDP-N-acetylmuramate dehydrogenase [Clostridia bacterium]|nr:UDP-N-acetylmuramate dehydrogenase [Clostridia bacterium]